MKGMQEAADKSIGRAARWPVLLGTVLTMGIALGSQASAQSGDAEKL